MVKRAEGTEFKSCLRRRNFSVSSYQWLIIGTPMTTLPGARRYRVSAGRGWTSFSVLWLGEVESLICTFYLSVAACKLVWADQSPRYTSILLGCSAAIAGRESMKVMYMLAWEVMGEVWHVTGSWKWLAHLLPVRTDTGLPMLEVCPSLEMQPARLIPLDVSCRAPV